MKLALIAGRGRLPAEVAAALNKKPLVCSYEGFTPDGLTPDFQFRLETLGTLLHKLHEINVTSVCFCGGIERPSFDVSALDERTMPLVPRFQKALSSGDDGALRLVKELFEDSGFQVVAADQLQPELLPPSGVLSTRQPDEQMHRDAAHGARLLDALSELDIGQACVVGRLQALGVETFGGTDHLLQTLPEAAAGMSAILCKGPKRNQIREIDLPTIGPDTVEAAAKAGLAGVVIEAGSVILLDRAYTIARADALGVVLWVRERDER